VRRFIEALEDIAVVSIMMGLAEQALTNKNSITPPTKAHVRRPVAEKVWSDRFDSRAA
jgi:hypothetical protein